VSDTLGLENLQPFPELSTSPFTEDEWAEIHRAIQRGVDRSLILDKVGRYESLGELNYGYYEYLGRDVNRLTADLVRDGLL
jgi:hypothetical protein